MKPRLFVIRSFAGAAINTSSKPIPHGIIRILIERDARQDTALIVLTTNEQDLNSTLNSTGFGLDVAQRQDDVWLKHKDAKSLLIDVDGFSSNVAPEIVIL